MLLAAADTRPAGGAAIGEVILASAIGLGLTAVLLGLVWLHRTRRSQVLTRVGNRLGKATGVPAWVALPTVLTTLSLLVALLGMLWDISLHIGVGRDEGPLANPAHYLILFGLFGVFAGGIFACAMPLDEKPGPAAVHFIRGWDVPVGGILLTGAGFYALLGFPLDDVWHRLFGQDVTLWGPTHLMLITGAGLSIIGLLMPRAGGPRRPVHRRRRPQGRPDHPLRAAGLGDGWPAARALGVPGRVRLRRPAVPAGPRAVHDRRCRGPGPGRRPPVHRPRGCAGGRRLLRGHPGRHRAHRRPRLRRDRPDVPAVPRLGDRGRAARARRCRWSVGRSCSAPSPVSRIGTLGHATESGWTRLTQTLSWNSDILVEGTLMAIAGGVAGRAHRQPARRPACAGACRGRPSPAPCSSARWPS